MKPVAPVMDTVISAALRAQRHILVLTVAVAVAVAFGWFKLKRVGKKEKPAPTAMAMAMANSTAQHVRACLFVLASNLLCFG